MRMKKIRLLETRLFATDEELATKCRECGKTWGEHTPLTTINRHTGCRFYPVKEKEKS